MAAKEYQLETQEVQKWVARCKHPVEDVPRWECGFATGAGNEDDVEREIKVHINKEHPSTRPSRSTVIGLA